MDTLIFHNKTVPELKEISDQLWINLDQLYKEAIATTNLISFLKKINEADLLNSSVGGMLVYLGYVSPHEYVRDFSRSFESVQFDYELKLYENVELFDVIFNYYLSFHINDDVNADDKRYIEKLYTLFVHNGAEFDQSIKPEINQIKKIIKNNEIEFRKDLATSEVWIDVKDDDVTGVLPNLIVDGRILLIPSTASHVISNATSSKLRYKSYKAYNTQCKTNLDLIEHTLELRSQLSTIFNYHNYNEYILYDKMMNNPADILTFLEDLNEKLAPTIEDDFKTLGLTDQSYISDIQYAETQYSKSKGIDHEKIKEYFDFERVMNVICEFYKTHFKLNVVRDDPDDQCWGDMIKYSVYENFLLGLIYVDPFYRKDKYKTMAVCSIVSSLKQSNIHDAVVGVSIMMLNLDHSLDATDPCLISHDQLVRIFHEFGHAIHDVIGKTKYVYCAGACVQRDFVETPSIFLEHFCWEPSILKSMSCHYESGKPLPDEMINSLIANRYAMKSTMVRYQIFIAYLDQMLHQNNQQSIISTYQNIFKSILQIKNVKDANFLVRFPHIMGGYVCSYYSYVLCDAIATDLYAHATNNSTMSSYVNNILRVGGSIDAKKAINNFLGRNFNVDAYVNAYTNS